MIGSEPVSGLLFLTSSGSIQWGAIAAEAEWLAKGDDARFMSEVSLRIAGRD
jgi:hypothetical protein